MQIWVITHENLIMFHYHWKIYFHFKVSEAIFYDMLCPKLLNFQKRAFASQSPKSQLKNPFFSRILVWNYNFLILFHWYSHELPVGVSFSNFQPFGADFKNFQFFDILVLKIVIFENSTILSTKWDSKCTYSLSNENIFSCDDEI